MPCPQTSRCGRVIATLAVNCGSVDAQAPPTPSLTIHVDQPGRVIARNLFGQLVGQRGCGIYEGVWVGKDSQIPIVRGIRSDVVKALRTLKVPNLRWPGGCIADQYHWRNGVGPKDKRRDRLTREE